MVGGLVRGEVGVPRFVTEGDLKMVVPDRVDFFLGVIIIVVVVVIFVSFL